jgi:predicted AlkP superfamily pyrophosphatase or phosphodiesterase
MVALVCALAAVAAPAPTRTKLVLTLVVDQFRYDYLTRFRPDYKGGLARLLEKGAVFTNAHYEHFPTVTAIGHATILSGAPPSISGIVGNTWFDRQSGKQVSSVSDPSVKLLGGAGKGAASPHRLLVSTLGDELKMSGKGQSRVIGISIKDRSAILPVGRMADGAYWFDDATGNFVSSTFYFEDLPGWVKDFNQSRLVDKFLNAEWTRAGGTPFRRMTAKAGPAYYKSMESTPFGNEILAMFAERAIESERLGQREAVDLLALSFSANDYVGHSLGPDSAEVRDISLRTDELLGRFLDFVDRSVGLDKVIVVLTADHGVAPMPEVMQSRRMPGGRMTEQSVLDTVQARLTEVFGEGKWVVGNSGPAPYLNHELMRLKKLPEAEVQRVAAEAVRNLPQILRVYTRDQLVSGRVLQDRIDRRVQNGFFYERASDLFVVAKPYWLFEERGTSHGTPFSYDSHVPLVFLGSGIRAGFYNRPAAVNDIAPTLATLLEVETPSGSVGRVLDEMLGGP